MPDQPAPQDDSLPPGTDALDLGIERHRRMTVAVSIMDEGPFRFIVDTGAQASVLSTTLADRLELNERKVATLIALNSSRAVVTARVPQVSLGSRTFGLHAAPLLDPLHLNGADGILGLDSLQHSRVMIDFGKDQMTVTDTDAKVGSGYDIVVRARRQRGQLIITKARIDGIETVVILDTGAQSSVGNLALERRLVRARSIGNGRLTDVNGVAQTGAVRVARSLVIDRMELGNVAIVFADSPSFAALGLDKKPTLLLGMAELRAFERVVINFSERRVLFDLPRNTVRPSGLTRRGRR